MKIKKVLVANRGEIAVRIIRACHELDIPTVAVYSEGDTDSLHVKMADEAFCIGPAAPNKSYNNITSVVATAELSGANAIHPGFGFLAENPKFAQICEENNIIFIGPSSKNISLMGNKSEARKTLISKKIATTPGSEGTISDAKEAMIIAKKIGFPVIVKASAGGGGKGMRIVEKESELEKMMNIAQQEAKSAFDNDEVYLEKYIKAPRHIEVQILADKHGNAIHLFERNCSIQRRHQKLIEESPSPALSNEVRKKLGDTAVKIVKAIGYENAGTIEFLMDDKDNFYFMEMNTRIQVEHTVSEEVTGIDLIKEQIRVASGEKLANKQKDISIHKHAIEFRINAENWAKGFMPCPGTITLFQPPGGIGIRVDTHIYQGYSVPPFYDSMLAKLIVSAPTREEAIARSRRALHEFVIEGVATTIPFHLEVLDNKVFQKGKFSTHFLEEQNLLKPPTK
jgi:acetyl-CoA carboxylase biotin carboxylase subunit